MAENRAKTTLKETVKEAEERFETRFKAIETLVADQNSKIEKTIEGLVAAQDARIEKSIAEMFEAIKLMTKSKTSVNETQRGDWSSPSGRSTSDLSFLNSGGEKSGKSGTGNTYAALTRLAKVDFPRFDGDKVKEWLFKVEEFFKLDRTPEDVKVKLAAIHFDGQASAWHQSMEESGQFKHLLLEWVTYKLLLKERFEDVFEDPVAELKQLQETDGIVAYQAKFEVIRTRINLPEDFLVRTYLAGLRTDTQMHIRMFDPQTVKQCFMLGRLYEKAHPEEQYTASGSISRSSSFNTAGKGILPLPKEGETKLQAVSKAPSKPTSPTSKKHLSQEEMSERRAKGLCYLCDEKFTPEHYLQHKKTQVFMIEVEDESGKDSEDVEQDIDEDIKPRPRISVHAVSGVADYNTMRVRGTYNKRNLFILIDSGSTHNFMDPKVTEKLGCVVKSAGGRKVSVADGKQLDVQGLIEVFKWQFQSVEFETSLMLIPLGGCDMVLGIQWLKTLGPITWNFDKLDMGFKMGKQKVLLHGMKPGSVREVKAQKLNNLQEGQAQISMICVQQIPTDNEMLVYSLDCSSQANNVSSEVDNIFKLQGFPSVHCQRQRC